MVIDSILGEVFSWLLVTKEFHDCSQNDFMRDWVACISMTYNPNDRQSKVWVPPLVGMLKLNFNGASFGNPGPTGFRCVIRDSHGVIIHVRYGPIGRNDSTKAELIGLL